MDLATIEMPAKEARARFLEYKRSVRERHNDEDAAIMRGYKWLANGQRLISLPETIAAGGVGDDGLPRLAIARADLQWVKVSINPAGTIRYHRSQKEEPWNWDRHCAWSAKLCISLGQVLPRKDARWVEGQAMVPIIPPALRPKSLSGYHVLFEAEWTKIPPRDPALLKHAGGDLWAVVAVWDLTELERAVLSGRRNA